MNRIDQNSRGQKLLSIYFSAGHPNLEDTVPILKPPSGRRWYGRNLPFSDPLADGPTIQESSTKALRNGMTTEKLFSQLENIREHITIRWSWWVILTPWCNTELKILSALWSYWNRRTIIPTSVDVYHEEYNRSLTNTDYTICSYHTANPRGTYSLHWWSIQWVYLYGE